MSASQFEWDFSSLKEPRSLSSAQQNEPLLHYLDSCYRARIDKMKRIHSNLTNATASLESTLVLFQQQI